MTRRFTWNEEEGWACSTCSWVYPLSIRVTHPTIRRAFDRVALAQFAEHVCACHHPRNGHESRAESYIGKMRLLVMRGSTPEEAVRRVLKEVSSHYRDQPAMIKKAREEADKFLRRIDEGLL